MSTHVPAAIVPSVWVAASTKFTLEFAVLHVSVVDTAVIAVEVVLQTRAPRGKVSGPSATRFESRPITSQVMMSTVRPPAPRTVGTAKPMRMSAIDSRIDGTSEVGFFVYLSLGVPSSLALRLSGGA